MSRPAGERLAAMTTYVMLIVAPFTLGALAILAILIAYARRGKAEPLARSHFDHQIRSFWADLIIVVVGFICGWGAIVAGIGAIVGDFGVKLPAHADASHVGLGAIALALIWLLLWLWGIGGLVLGSVFGALRLASGRPAGKTRLS
jgi:uncharacterized membrane protein